MVMLSREPATTTSMSLNSSSAKVGLRISSPSMRPTRTPAIGVSKGMSEIRKAAAAPVMLSTSALFSPSVESTLSDMVVSLR